MTVYFVSRHERAHFWMQSQIQRGRIDLRVDRWLTHLDVREARDADVVVGTLPFNDVLLLQQRGARFLSLVMDLPAEVRGQELSATEMSAYGARLVELDVRPKAETPIAAAADETIEENWPDLREIRFAFVSDQLAPLYLAALNHHARTDVFVLFTTQRMRGKAACLGQVLASSPASGTVVRVELLDQNGEDYDALLRSVRLIVRDIHDQRPEVRLVGDLTGGTKPMALALATVMGEFRARGVPTRCQYTNTDSTHFQWISPQAASEALTVHLGVGEALALQGKQVRGIASMDAASRARMLARRASTEGVLAQASEQTIGTLNYMLSERAGASRTATGSTTAIALTPDQRHNQPLQKLLSRLAGAHLFAVARDRRHVIEAITLQDAETADYLQGKWLEEWIWLQLADLGADDVAMGVDICDDNNPDNRNEIDLIVMHRNRMLVIEAKTAVMKDDERSAEVIYEIDARSSKLAQLFATRLLVSGRQLGQFTLSRALNSRICVLCDRPDYSRGSGQGPGRYAGPLIDCLPLSSLAALVSQWMHKGQLSDASGRTSPFHNPEAEQRRPSRSR